jgi:hypothetical protein
MCGKALPYRLCFKPKKLIAARLSLAAMRKKGRQSNGKPEAFRTSGGKAAITDHS